MRLRLTVALCLALAGSTGSSSLQSLSQLSRGSSDDHSAPLPKIGDVIDRMVERAKRQDEEGVELGYESRITTTIDTLNDDGEVTKTERTLHKRYRVEDWLFEELIERNGRALTEKERKEELDRREKFAREARKRAEGDDARPETNDERQVRLGWDLITRFQASLVGADTIDDEPCWVVDFKPREGKLPEKTRMDRVLNRSSGTLYISRQDFGLRRVEFEMGQSVRYFWGLARLRRAHGRLEFERVELDVWLPKRYEIGIDLRVFFSSRRQQITREWIERRILVSTAD